MIGNSPPLFPRLALREGGLLGTTITGLACVGSVVALTTQRTETFNGRQQLIKMDTPSHHTGEDMSLKPLFGLSPPSPRHWLFSSGFIKMRYRQVIDCWIDVSPS
jgi:hypothetical protein